MTQPVSTTLFHRLMIGIHGVVIGMLSMAIIALLSGDPIVYQRPVSPVVYFFIGAAAAVMIVCFAVIIFVGIKGEDGK